MVLRFMRAVELKARLGQALMNKRLSKYGLNKVTIRRSRCFRTCGSLCQVGTSHLFAASTGFKLIYIGEPRYGKGWTNKVELRHISDTLRSQMDFDPLEHNSKSLTLAVKSCLQKPTSVQSEIQLMLDARL